MKEQPLLVCMPVKGTPLTQVIAGAKKSHCMKCGCEVWLAPSSLTIHPNDPRICLPCLPTIAEGDVIQVRVTPEQVAEVRKHFAGMN